MKRTNPIIALLAALQRAVTPRGIKIQAHQTRSPSRVPFLSPKRSYQST